MYNGARLENQQPTRLGLDATSEQQWRDLGFYSVLARGEDTRSLFEKMIRLGKERTFAPNSKLPEEIELGIARQNQCTSNADFADYAEDHPWEGMPLAVTGLTDDEYATLIGWLQQGGALSPARLTVSDDEQQQIDRWERWLNGDGNEQQLVSRWLYEHLYLARLYLEDRGADTRFFEILRSATPPGETIAPVATTRPNDDPQGPVYYRIRPVNGSIVHKRHITFAFTPQVRERTRELFSGTDWQVDTLPGYGAEERANRFSPSAPFRRGPATSSCWITPNTSPAPLSAGRCAGGRSLPMSSATISGRCSRTPITTCSSPTPTIASG